MTSRNRQAIVQYWLWKRWIDLGPGALRRFCKTSRFRAFLWAIFFLAFSSVAMAADPNKLVSTESKPEPLKVLQQALKIPAKKAAGAPALKVAKPQLPSISKEDKEAEGEVKELQGKVSGVSNYGLAVEYGDGSSEMWADLLKETKLDGFKKMKDLQYGDTVEITYKELKESRKRLLQKVNFIRKKPQERDSNSNMALSRTSNAVSAGISISRDASSGDKEWGKVLADFGARMPTHGLFW